MQLAFEEISKTTLLGIRLWDPVFDYQIRDALDVLIYPRNNVKQRDAAYRTIGDVYTFSHIRGMRDLEYALVPSAPTSPPVTRQYIVTVSDSLRRYVDIAFQVGLPLPYKGVFLSGQIGSPSGNAPKGLHLYSSLTRTVPNWMAQVRGELFDHVNNRPAAWALLRLTAEGGEISYGIADGQGRFIIIFPYPVLVEGFGGSPATSSGNAPLDERVWNLDLEIRYSPGMQESLPGTDMPDYLSILSQHPAQLWKQAPGNGVTPISVLPLQLAYRKSIIIRTEGLSDFLVSPDITSP